MSARPVLVRMALIAAVCVVGFALLQARARQVEAAAAAGVLRALGADHLRVLDNSILVIPSRASHSSTFTAVVGPSCSALAAVLALVCLTSLVPRGPRGRRAAAALLACGLVAGGNVLRIAASVGIGFVAGRASLVLFHDWVGTAFGFAYTLGGFMVMLAVLLPSPAEARA